jgi:hypothetical protein
MVAFLIGCDDLAKQLGYVPEKPASAKPQTPVQRAAPAHRFVLATRDTDLAFDTQTGQLCRTWDWKPTLPPLKPEPASGLTPQRMPGELTPTCLSLYEQYATRTDINDPLGILQDSNQSQTSQ